MPMGIPAFFSPVLKKQHVRLSAPISSALTIVDTSDPHPFDLVQR
ncbi:hypothetical protein [Ktedonobacter sp. SOSP1-52]|nr:hypothetical protein [Ktedonobacter sp. SOSP1-52]